MKGNTAYDFFHQTQERSITGHIDFLQVNYRIASCAAYTLKRVRNSAVHILDYKPDARTNKPVAQLTVYALALSRLTGIKLNFPTGRLQRRLDLS